MRIAQIAPLAERIPPRKYGGTERIVHTLTEELVKLGHQVTLFASGDSQTSGDLISLFPKSLRETNTMESHGFIASMMNMGLAYSLQHEFDVIHDHNAHFTLPTASIAQTPTVVTLHGPFDHINRPYFRKFRNNIHLVAISQAQADRAPELSIRHVVHNGLPMEEYPFSTRHDGYLLFVGRISQEKGVHFAIEAAKTLDMPLIIAAKLDAVDVSYFKEKIEPHLSSQIQWIGEVNEQKRNELMSKAQCVLHPTNWHEPFGLTLIEAMACGAPVVAYNKGSIPEIIKDGSTGFVAEDLSEMIHAIANSHRIRRIDCRKHALTHFNARKMATKYLKIYKSILKPQLEVSRDERFSYLH